VTRRCGVLVALTLLGCGPSNRAVETLLAGAVTVGATTRTYRLDVPPSARRSAAVPLVIAFHGTGSSGAAMAASSGLDEIASRDGFLVAYPDAPVGNWAEGCNCNRADLLGVNDTGFVRTLIDSVAARFPVDRSRIYATGFSQGGLFVHRLACELAGTFAAVASVAAPMSGVLAARCSPSQPVSVLVMLGTFDDAFPYEGRGEGDRTTLGARATVERWRELDGCAAMPVGSALPNLVADGTAVLEERWTRCLADAEVVLYTVEGGRHAWRPSRDIETASLLAAFFLRHRR
jgi:polyhydroxybutyrate depolymerase